MSEQCRITTIDNPFNPFTQFYEWFVWDESHGYHSSGLIDRISASSRSLSEDLNNALDEQAIDELIELFPGRYRKVRESDVYPDSDLD